VSKRKGTGRFEIHEHWYVSGPKSRLSPGPRLVHSHEGGNTPHDHSQTGPGCYTIDRDEWSARTGLRGGSRKKFTDKPTGEQLPQRSRTDEENSFDVIIVGDAGAAASRGANGPVANNGTLLVPERLKQAFGMKVRSVKVVP
jgi:hypothetical protein